MRGWFIRGHGRRGYQFAIDHSIVGVSFGAMTSMLDAPSWDFLVDHVARSPGDTPIALAKKEIKARQLYAFINEIQVGDVVAWLTTGEKGADVAMRVGRIRGPVGFAPLALSDAEIAFGQRHPDPVLHYWPVDWLGPRRQRGKLRPGLSGPAQRSKTVHPLKDASLVRRLLHFSETGIDPGP